MANSIQAIRNVYDFVKNVKDNGNSLSDEYIQMLLEQTVSDSELIKQYKRFEKGYAAEDLFMRVYSLLPWVKLITPLGQEQFPEKSKEKMQVTDYEVIYENGDQDHTKCILVEVKLVDGNKETQEIKKNQYEVLRDYATKKNMDILYALFWRRYGFWTLVPIEAYREKSSVYKISLNEAYKSDVSAIFGDYTYIFRNNVYRKSKYSCHQDVKSEYCHSHEKYGLTIYESLSCDGKDYSELSFIEPPVLDCAFDFKVTQVSTDGDVTELVEVLDNIPYFYRLSHLILKFLLKVYCYNTADMHCYDNDVVKNAFHIVDTVRRKCGGEKYYLIPGSNRTTDKLFYLQFQKASHIIDCYERFKRGDYESGVAYVNHNSSM